MNIAFIIPSMDIGGAERVALFLADHYRILGDNVRFFFLQKGGKSFSCAYPSNHLNYKFHCKAADEQLRWIIKAACEMKKLKKKYHIDISLSFMEDSNHINILSKNAERIIISTRTTLSARSDLTNLVYNSLLIKVLYNRAEKIVATSTYSKIDLIENYGVSEKKIETIPNPAVRYNPHRSMEWNYGENVILHIGRLDPVKQQDRIIRAFSLVHKNIPDAKLIILGDGIIRNYLKYICRKMNVESCVYLPGFEYDVGHYILHSKVLVMASKAEGFPNAMVEAMACGIPVVTTDSPGGCPEIVGKKQREDGIQFCEYGILTPYMKGKANKGNELEREEVLLAEAMIKLLNDQTLYEQYSIKSLERAKHFDKNNILNMWDKVIYGKQEDN
ncbi:MAG: glycosyltransferase [Lachnospiraceae bacterium]|jgi:glycosyltransferase involved in cell wall biosynthesis|nr:glycosyltransferase [Lachnospiraceae bacterium]